MVNGLKARVSVLVAAGMLATGGLLGVAGSASAAVPQVAPGSSASSFSHQLPMSDHIIRPPATLWKNQAWTSGNGRAILRLQEDGNLVLYKDGHAAWQAPNTWSHGNKAVFQEDGNFVVYNSADQPVWASNTWRKGAYLAVQDDGNVVIYDSGHRPVWATNTGD